MNHCIESQVRLLLATFVDVTPEAFRMDADLDRTYDMDSTELTALAMEIETRFGVKADKSARDDWTTGQKVSAFVQKHLAAAPVPDLAAALA